MEKVVVIKFKRNCKPYYFSPNGLKLERGQNVIVETSRGEELGMVAIPEKEVEKLAAPLKNVLRIATKRDLETAERNEQRQKEAMEVCREKIKEHGQEMKLISCDIAFDGSKILFYFSAENRVDFRGLVKDLAGYFHTRIELRQIGIRDEAKLLGGIAPCGRECCCASCMPQMNKVGIKMAKNQGLSLNPGKISGLCGRLMCCLSYENEYYASVYKKMPKLGGNVGTPEGHGTVVSTNMLNMTVRVKIEKDGSLFYRDFPVDKLTFKRSQEKEKEKEEDDDDKLSEE